MRAHVFALGLAVASPQVVGCSNDRSYGEKPDPGAQKAPRRATPSVRPPAATASPPASASPPSSPSSASSATSAAWPRGTVCGVEARDVTALGDAVQWRVLEWKDGVETLTESLRDVTRTGDDLLAAGFARAAGGAADAYDRIEPGRDLTMTLYPKGRAKLFTHCEAKGEHTTAAAERAGWITSYVHRRIGHGVLASLKASDGDERYVRAQIDGVTAQPDPSGLVEAAKGAYRNAPGAEPESLVILNESPLLVEYRAGNQALIDAGIQMHQKQRLR